MSGAARRPAAVELVRSSAPMDRWLWCLCCERFFQVREMRYDAYEIERCAFADCIGAGLDRDIFLWDEGAVPADARGPCDHDQRSVGLRSPQRASERQQRARREARALIDGFADSPEAARLRGTTAARWSRELVDKLGWWGVHPADVDGEYLARALRELAYWVSCRATDAGEITAELAAFFAYGARQHGWPHARACALFLTDAAVTAELARCIREHRRRRRRS